MSAPEQMPLLPVAAHDSELVRLFAAIVERAGLKTAAYDLDVAASQLAHCCAGRGSNHLRLTWLSWAIRQPGGDELLEYLASLRGCEVVPMKPLDPAEELAALKEALATSLAPDMRALVEAKARKVAARR